MSNKDWNQSAFNVEGRISFTITSKTNEPIDGAALRQLIEQVDRENPWKCCHRDGQPADSIRWLSAPIIEEATEWSDLHYTFEVRPSFPMRPDQFYAYHRYLGILASQLAELAPTYVVYVNAWIEIGGGGCQTYSTATGRESLARTMAQPAYRQLKAACDRAFGA